MAVPTFCFFVLFSSIFCLKKATELVLKMHTLIFAYGFIRFQSYVHGAKYTEFLTPIIVFKLNRKPKISGSVFLESELLK